MQHYKITIVSDINSWINSYIPELIENFETQNHLLEWTHNVNNIKKGDFVFYLSCGQIVKREILDLNKHNLVVHESDLPEGKGWSPLSWQILEGRNEIPICLFEAAEKVDSGQIYIKKKMIFNGDELVNELRDKQAEYSISMCKEFIENYPDIIKKAQPQSGKETFYPKRTPADSMLDANKSLTEQFNLLRIVDNENYPAYFIYNGNKYILKIEKVHEK